MKPVMWDDRVQVQISEKNPVSTNHMKIEAARVGRESTWRTQYGDGPGCELTTNHW